jgi:hypothetical protein
VLNTYDLRALTAVYRVTKGLRPTGEVCNLARAELIDTILDAEFRPGRLNRRLSRNREGERR